MAINMFEFLFPLLLIASGISFLVAIILALMGLFGSDDTQNAKYNALAAKLFLAATLAFVIGFGTCVASF